jgi:hypothetical protein
MTKFHASPHSDMSLLLGRLAIGAVDQSCHPLANSAVENTQGASHFEAGAS